MREVNDYNNFNSTYIYCAALCVYAIEVYDNNTYLYRRTEKKKTKNKRTDAPRVYHYKPYIYVPYTGPRLTYTLCYYWYSLFPRLENRKQEGYHIYEVVRVCVRLQCFTAVQGVPRCPTRLARQTTFQRLKIFSDDFISFSIQKQCLYTTFLRNKK